MDFFEAVKTRASCRAFVKCEVKEADLAAIVEAGVRAPTAFTVQPWHFVVVRNEETLAALGRVQPCVADASAAVVAIGAPTKSDFWREDVSAAVENMHLACAALGYESLWVAVLDKTLVNPVLSIPNEFAPLAILAIGRAAAPVEQAGRRPISAVVHDETFGVPYSN